MEVDATGPRTEHNGLEKGRFLSVSQRERIFVALAKFYKTPCNATLV